MRTATVLMFAILAGLTLFCTPDIARAQNESMYYDTLSVERQDVRPQPFGIGIGLNVNIFNGDVQDNGNAFPDAENPLRFGGELHAEYSLLRLGTIGKLALKGMFTFNPIEARAKVVEGIEPPESYYNFTNNTFNFAVALQMELFPKSRLRPFVYAGIGFMVFDPQIDASPLIMTRKAKYMTSDQTSSASVPAGGGFKYTAGSNLDIYASIYKTFNFTDNLDGWISDVNDNVLTISAGVMYYFGQGGKRTLEAAPVPVPVVTDTDGDGLLDADETGTYRTDPNNRDTDGDGLIDGDEVLTYKTDPLNRDTDGDRLIDGDEVRTHRTDPLKKDTDDDGCTDGDEVKDMKTDPLKKDTDGDGLTDCDERNIYRTNPLVVDTDGDGVDDGTEVRNGTDPLRADVMKIEQGRNLVLEGITFETNKATILPESEDILNKAYNTLRTNPEVRVEIGGHTDDVGRDAANLRLSEARARSVRDWLVARGIATNRMTTKGYGETVPLVPNDSPENRAKNRRIEFKLLP